MTKLTALVLFAACGNVTFPDSPDAGVDAHEPDAGMTEPPLDPAVLSIVPRAVIDERGDVIGFSSGEPLHLHAGATVMLGSAGCPALSRYGYLLDRHPIYGKENSPNPLAVTVALPDALVADSAEYRVNVGNDSFSSWTMIPGSAGERATIALYRDDIPALGTFDGPIRVEVRARVTTGAEQTAAACWTHHPLLAPLAISPPQPAMGGGTLSAVKLASSQAYSLLPAGEGYSLIDAISIRIEQQTSEPVKLEVTPSAPAGSYSVTVADAFVQTSSGNAGRNCALEPDYCNSDPVPDPADVVRSGTLASGSWYVYLREDGAALATDCPHNVCVLPGRAPGTPVRRFQVIAMLRDLEDLWPVASTATQTSIPGSSVVGAWLTSSVVRCKQVRVIGDTASCISWAEYVEIQALDRARIDLAPTAIRLGAAPGTGTRYAPLPYLAGSTLTAPALTWDGGDGPL